MNKKMIAAWIILAFLAAAGIVVFMFMKSAPHIAPEALIYSDGTLIRTVSLSDSCEFTVKSENGYNTIRVSDGCIAVTDADCPDKVCIRTGTISSGAVPIICLPHKLEIRIVSGDNDIDAIIN